jgi:hypothetical protein
MMLFFGAWWMLIDFLSHCTSLAYLVYVASSSICALWWYCFGLKNIP